MKATLLKQTIVLKNWNGYRSTVTEYTVEETSKTYRIGHIYDNVHQLKKRLKKNGFTSFEIVKLGSQTRKAMSI